MLILLVVTSRALNLENHLGQVLFRWSMDDMEAFEHEATCLMGYVFWFPLT